MKALKGRFKFLFKFPFPLLGAKEELHARGKPFWLEGFHRLLENGGFWKEVWVPVVTRKKAEGSNLMEFLYPLEWAYQEFVLIRRNFRRGSHIQNFLGAKRRKKGNLPWGLLGQLFERSFQWPRIWSPF